MTAHWLMAAPATTGGLHTDKNNACDYFELLVSTTYRLPSVKNLASLNSNESSFQAKVVKKSKSSLVQASQISGLIALTYITELNILGVLEFWSNKTRHLKTSLWALGSCDSFLLFYILQTKQ